MKIFATIVLALSSLSLVACSSTPTSEASQESPATLTVAEADPVPYETRGEFLAAIKAELSTFDARLAELKSNAADNGMASLRTFTDHQAELIELRESVEYQLRRVHEDPEIEWRNQRDEIESTLDELEETLDDATAATLSASA